MLIFFMFISCAVMQFGGQHGGVPTFGVALPGYVQPEHGTGNPEMTWYAILPFRCTTFVDVSFELAHLYVF